MKWIAQVFLLTCTISLCGCLSGELSYVKPTTTRPSFENSVIISKSKDMVWRKLIPEIGKTFWVINNLDKESGLINISYTGNPGEYVDCGRIKSSVINAQGERNYNFQASDAYQKYEIAEGYVLFFIERKMNLEGRVNLIVQEISPLVTQFSINPKFILSRTINLRDTLGRAKTDIDTISFNSVQTGKFNDGGTECVSNGALEASILGLIKSIQ